MFGNEYFPRGYPQTLMLIQLPALFAGLVIIWHIFMDTSGSRFAIMTGSFVIFLSLLGGVCFNLYFTFVVWQHADIPVGIGNKKVENNYELLSKSQYAMSTVLWGAIFLIVAVWYCINVIVYKGYYDKEPVDCLLYTSPSPRDRG